MFTKIKSIYLTFSITATTVLYCIQTKALRHFKLVENLHMSLEQNCNF